MGELRPPHGQDILSFRFVVGLTGGIGSGKSTVAACLAELGAAVLDADAIVHRLYDAGEPGATVIGEHVGQEFLTPDGAVDRARLAERLFTDAELRRQVEARIHPLVIAAMDDWVAAQPSSALPVLEVALLIETGGHRRFPCVVVVGCASEVQLARIADRHPDWTADEIEARVAAQMPFADKQKVAHHVLDNSGTRAELRRACADLYPRLVRAKSESEE